MSHNDNDDIGLDLLMNPKKQINRSGSEKSYNSSSSKANKNKSKASISHSIYSSSQSSASSDSLHSTNSSRSSSSSDDSFSTISVQPKVKKYSQDEILAMKKEILYQFDRLEKKGIILPRKFTLASSLEEMKTEYERLKKEREVDISVRFQRKMLMTIITGIEFLNDKFDPFDVKLNGWSESVNDNILDYDDIFEELHEKYKGKANMPPELKLMFALGGSAFMFHLRNTMLKSSLSGLDQVMQQQQQKATNNNGGGFNIGNMFGSFGNLGNLFGQTSTKPTNSSPMNQFKEGAMRGPSDIDNILKEMHNNNNNNDRVEMMSTISESEISMSVKDDNVKNIVNHSINQKKKGDRMKQRRTLNIS